MGRRTFGRDELRAIIGSRPGMSVLHPREVPAAARVAAKAITESIRKRPEDRIEAGDLPRWIPVRMLVVAATARMLLRPTVAAPGSQASVSVHEPGADLRFWVYSPLALISAFLLAFLVSNIGVLGLNGLIVVGVTIVGVALAVLLRGILDALRDRPLARARRKVVEKHPRRVLEADTLISIRLGAGVKLGKALCDVAGEHDIVVLATAVGRRRLDLYQRMGFKILAERQVRKTWKCLLVRYPPRLTSATPSPGARLVLQTAAATHPAW